MGTSVRNSKLRTVWVALFAVSALSGVGFAQTSNLAYQVANMAEDVRILDEAVRSLRAELENIRRENNQLRSLVSGYETRMANSVNQLATVGQLNEAIATAVNSLQKRDDVMKDEIILQVTKQITEFANTVKSSISGLPAAPAKPNPEIRTHFPENFPKNSGIQYTVRSGDTLSTIAEKFGSTVDWIQNANQIPSPRHLQVGRTLWIPQN